MTPEERGAACVELARKLVQAGEDPATIRKLAEVLSPAGFVAELAARVEERSLRGRMERARMVLPLEDERRREDPPRPD